MNTKAARKILKQVAIKYGISEQEVRTEIEKAIELAKANTDTKVHGQFSQIKCKGDVPTPEEFLIYMTEKCREKR